MHVIGIDAGGTKTVALLADADGHVVAEGRAGAANLHTEGELEVEKILHTVIDLATDGREVTLSAVCLGIAGVDREDDARIIRGIMRRMGNWCATRGSSRRCAISGDRTSASTPPSST